jgi:large subunit ribosomal protein L25
MEDVVLKAQPRTVTGKQVRGLRRQGLLPAVIYGHNFEPIIISLDHHNASRALPHVTSSQLITVDVNGAPYTVLVREKQRDPISSTLLHVDFLAVSMTEKLRVTVGIEFTGEAPAIKTYDGIVVTSREQLEVESLPRDLPNHIEISLSGLAEIGDAIYVRDVTVAPGVTLLDNPDDVIVLVTPPLSEAQLAQQEGGAFEPEVIEKGKKEEEDF